MGGRLAGSTDWRDSRKNCSAEPSIKLKQRVPHPTHFHIIPSYPNTCRNILTSEKQGGENYRETVRLTSHALRLNILKLRFIFRLTILSG